MKLNKVYEGEFFQAISLDGCGRVDLLPSEQESIDGVKKGIDRFNKMTEINGFEPKQWLIVRKVWNRIKTPDDIFVASHESVSVIEMYPKNL